MPRLAAQDVLVRNRWFRISISARLMVSAGAEDIKAKAFRFHRSSLATGWPMRRSGKWFWHRPRAVFSSSDKAAWMKAELGYDAVIVIGSAPIAEQRAC